MPFPFLAHQAAVLPLKRAFPRWWSGTALVIGSMAPDLGYFLLGLGVARDWHRPLGVLLYCLPLSLVLHWITTRWLAEPAARHLPRVGAWRLQELAFVAAQPRAVAHWLVVIASILVGAGTHLAWDLFTHGGSWMGDYVPWLDGVQFHIAGRAVIGSSVLWIGSTLVGAAATLGMVGEATRSGRLRDWAEERAPGSTAGITPDAPPVTGGFWTTIFLATVVGGVLGVASRPPGFHLYEKAAWVIIFLRASSIGFLALCLACWRERRAWRQAGRPPPRTSVPPRP